jgi:DNA repair exonuclease SbcCD ATPase subunit
VLNFDFNLNNRGLLPGDTVRYFVRAVDNAPQGHVGLSREFVLRLPTLSEVRAAAREASQEVGRSFDSLAADSRRLERSTEDLATERERPATDPNRSGNQSAMSYEASQRAEAVARSQEQMMERAEALKEALAELQRSAEAAGLNDPAWQQRLQEIREQLERALTPELKERLAALQQSLKDLDPERAKEALQRLAEAQQKLREALERSQELFKRAAMEGDMANLAAESDELAREQQQWSEQTEQASPERSSAEEQDLAARADSLATQLEKLASQMAEPDRKDRMDSAAAQASDAAQQMQQAAQSAGQQQRRQARQHGEQAAQKTSAARTAAAAGTSFHAAGVAARGHRRHGPGDGGDQPAHRTGAGAFGKLPPRRRVGRQPRRAGRAGRRGTEADRADAAGRGQERAGLPSDRDQHGGRAATDAAGPRGGV